MVHADWEKGFVLPALESTVSSLDVVARSGIN